MGASREAQTLAESLREHVDRSPVAIALIDATTLEVRYANASFQRLSGLGSPVLGASLIDALPAPAAQRVSSLLGDVRRSGEPRADVELELAPMEPETPCIYWSVTLWPVPARGGHATHVMLEVRNVTEQIDERRSRTETVEQLREINQRLLLASLREEDLRELAEAANAAKSIFLATMSHEFRTPLTAIIGYEELLADGVTGPVTDAQRAQLARIKASAEHLRALIDEVLTLARLEAGHETVRRREVNVVTILDEATTLVGPLATAKGLTFTAHLPERPLALNTDALKVRQILVNLLGNAGKFTERGTIGLFVREEGDWIDFDVRDTGVGIPPDALERVFDPFWQIPQTATRTMDGVGLGLSVARRLARLLGGTVEAASRVGHGSTFTLRLPLGREAIARDGRHEVAVRDAGHVSAEDGSSEALISRASSHDP